MDLSDCTESEIKKKLNSLWNWLPVYFMQKNESKLSKKAWHGNIIYLKKLTFLAKILQRLVCFLMPLLTFQNHVLFLIRGRESFHTDPLRGKKQRKVSKQSIILTSLLSDEKCRRTFPQGLEQLPCNRLSLRKRNAGNSNRELRMPGSADQKSLALLPGR